MHRASFLTRYIIKLAVYGRNRLSVAVCAAENALHKVGGRVVTLLFKPELPRRRFKHYRYISSGSDGNNDFLHVYPQNLVVLLVYAYSVVRFSLLPLRCSL